MPYDEKHGAPTSAVWPHIRLTIRDHTGLRLDTDSLVVAAQRAAGVPRRHRTLVGSTGRTARRRRIGAFVRRRRRHLERWMDARGRRHGDGLRAIGADPRTRGLRVGTRRLVRSRRLRESAAGRMGRRLRRADAFRRGRRAGRRRDHTRRSPSIGLIFRAPRQAHSPSCRADGQSGTPPGANSDGMPPVWMNTTSLPSGQRPPSAFPIRPASPLPL